VCRVRRRRASKRRRNSATVTSMSPVGAGDAARSTSQGLNDAGEAWQISDWRPDRFVTLEKVAAIRCSGRWSSGRTSGAGGPTPRGEVDDRVPDDRGAPEASAPAADVSSSSRASLDRG